MIKKLLFIILIFCLISFPCFSNETENSKNDIAKDIWCHSRVCIIKNIDKYGLKTNEFEERNIEYLPVEYDMILPINKYDLWLLKKDDKYGLYKKSHTDYVKGKFLLKCKYDEISRVGGSGFKVKKGNKYAFFGYYDEMLYGTYLTNFQYDDIKIGEKKDIAVLKNGKWQEKNSITLKNRIIYLGHIILCAPIGWLVFRGF